MRRLVVAVLILFCATAFGSEEIQVNYTRPSKMLGMLMHAKPGIAIQDSSWQEGSLIPQGVRVKADDAKGVLVVFGSTDDVNELRSYVQLFDVKQKEVHIRLDVDSPMDKYKCRSETTVANNTEWLTKTSDLDLNVSVAPRINDNGTLSLTIKFGPQDHVVKIVVRIPNGKPVDIVADDFLAGKSTENVAVLDTDKKRTYGTRTANATIISLYVKIVDDDKK